MAITTWLPVIVSLACVLLMTLSWRILNWVWFKPKRLERYFRDQGIRGNPYRILYGDSKERARMLAEARTKHMPQLSNDYFPQVMPFLHQTVKNYGNRCFIWNGPLPIVNISEPEIVREVLKEINVFQKPQSNPIFKMISTGLFMLEGKEWANRRKLINPAFHMENLKLMLPAFFASSYDIVMKWDEMAKETGSCEIDAWSYLHKLSADVISRAAFGSSYEEGSRIFELITEQLLVALPLLQSVYIPGWRFVPLKANKRLTEIDKEIRTLLKGIIEKRKKGIKAGDKFQEDLLGLLLESSTVRDTKIATRNTIGLSLEEVINECKLFYLAGQETTSTLLVWTLIMLGKHQDWQMRAREEVLAKFGKEIPDFEGLNHLKTVNMILQEVLRLYSPVTEINRTVCEDIKVGDISLPAGVQVHLPILLIQHDEQLWGADAKEFNPERFAGGISNASRGNMSFFSFGWGPRICIGLNFAMTEAKLALTLILQRFSFEISPSYVHAPTAYATLQPQFGAQIILHRI